MAVTFADLHTAEGLKALEQHLAGKTYVSGDTISKDDVKVFAAVPSKPGAEFPNAARWYDTVAAALASRFPGKSVGVNLPGAGAASTAAAAAPAAKDADEDDDDLDLFGDETEEDKKAADERAASKASAKKKESGKSSVLLDVKPWDDETDMKKLEEAVRSVQMEGLTWGASKLVPVGYGIKKLQIMLTIVDDLVSVDSLIEEHLTEEPINEYVQSCDIVAFNKI
ncbi:elongation factor 1-beta [Oryza brachyantha]|uniref:Translation elongation factor EF1B beta/delta subunit guanine nucleotide exchange domain-containing protein n=1 Tax=Oryza brachyantha TaxID=4533 RepID=J3MNT1_ORYBR|nr:elongation factor 1-beta [Oryza brachyantha]